MTALHGSQAVVVKANRGYREGEEARGFGDVKGPHGTVVVLMCCCNKTS